MSNADDSKMIAYHFVSDTLLGGQPVPDDGVWLEHDGDVVLCKSGLHASVCPFDALKYAPGTTLCLVELGGTVVVGNDKVVASRRKIIKRIDAEAIVREFARWCALQVVDLWDAPDVVRQYLTTGDESLRVAARDATQSSSPPARGAAWCAAFDDAFIAAWPAAWRAKDAMLLAAAASSSVANRLETRREIEESTRNASGSTSARWLTQ